MCRNDIENKTEKASVNGVACWRGTRLNIRSNAMEEVLQKQQTSADWFRATIRGNVDEVICRRPTAGFTWICDEGGGHFWCSFQTDSVTGTNERDLFRCFITIWLPSYSQRTVHGNISITVHHLVYAAPPASHRRRYWRGGGSARFACVWLAVSSHRDAVSSNAQLQDWLRKSLWTLWT